MITLGMKKLIRTSLSLVCAVAVAIGVGACGASSSSGSDKVAILISTLNNPFFVDLRDGAQQEAKKLGINLQVSDAQNDSTTSRIRPRTPNRRE